MATKAVFFDAAGTLFNSVRPVGETYAVFAQAHGMNVSPQTMQARFHACFGTAPPLAFPVGTPEDRLRDLERAWWHKVVQRIFEPLGSFPRFEEYFAALFNHFATPDSWRLYPEAQATLTALKDRGLILGVITNFDSRVLGILEGLGIARQFDGIVISSRVGHAKPDPGIFHAALSLYALTPEEAVHVGDSPSHDAAGASHAGLTAVLVDRATKAPEDSYIRVRDLQEVIPFIDRGR